MNARDLRGLASAAVAGWVDDYAQSMGAALAYYTLFAIAPLVLIVVSIAGLLFGDDAARSELFSQFERLLGAPAALAVRTLVQEVHGPAESMMATGLGIVLLLVGATSVFGELQDALDRIWRAPKETERSGIWEATRARLRSLGMILGIGFLLMFSLVASAALALLRNWWGSQLPGWAWVASMAELSASFLLITGMFAMIYKAVPRVRIDWKDVWIGAAVTSLLFTLGKYLIGAYVATSGVASGFGAATSLVLVLVWVYYSAQIFLLGAEFTRAYAHAFGSQQRPPPLPDSAAAASARSIT